MRKKLNNEIIIKKFKELWLNIIKRKVAITLIISVFALIISLLSYADSREALEITQKEYNSKRDIVLEGMDFGYKLEIESIDKNKRIQLITIYFPDTFSQDKIILDAKHLDFHYLHFTEILYDAIKDYLKNPAKGNSISVLSILVPISITINYISSGEKLEDTSLYNLNFSFRNRKNHELELNNLEFLKRLSNELDAIELINELWADNLKELIVRISDM